jgi:flagellar basal body-associated protein FliL
MSDKDDKAPKDKPAPKKEGVNVVGLVVTAVLAGAAAFGGARVAGARGGGGHGPPRHAQQEPPGFTLALEPFLLMAHDTGHRGHPMRVTLAVEFEQSVKEDGVRPFVPRIRDSALAYLRGVTYEDASDPARTEHLRAELLERFRGTGAGGVSRVLITDLVTQ